MMTQLRPRPVDGVLTSWLHYQFFLKNKEGGEEEKNLTHHLLLT